MDIAEIVDPGERCSTSTAEDCGQLKVKPTIDLESSQVIQYMTKLISRNWLNLEQFDHILKGAWAETMRALSFYVSTAKERQRMEILDAYHRTRDGFLTFAKHVFPKLDTQRRSLNTVFVELATLLVPEPPLKVVKLT